jgi:hypothetical protein
MATIRLRPARLWQPLTDAGGKIRRVTGGLGAFRDIASCSKLPEGYARVYLTPLVKELIEVTVGQ